MRNRLTSEIPLVSRDVEMGEILAKLKGPKPAAFVLAGAAGVGKTRLASEAARSATGLGFATAQAVASRTAAAWATAHAGWNERIHRNRAVAQRFNQIYRGI